MKTLLTIILSPVITFYVYRDAYTLLQQQDLLRGLIIIVLLNLVLLCFVIIVNLYRKELAVTKEIEPGALTEIYQKHGV